MNCDYEQVNENRVHVPGLSGNEAAHANITALANGVCLCNKGFRNCLVFKWKQQ